MLDDTSPLQASHLLSGSYIKTYVLDAGFAFSLCLLLQVSDEKVTSGYTAAEFHPDGLILGTGTADSTILIWEARTVKVRGTLQHYCLCFLPLDVHPSIQWFPNDQLQHNSQFFFQLSRGSR